MHHRLAVVPILQEPWAREEEEMQCEGCGCALTHLGSHVEVLLLALKEEKARQVGPPHYHACRGTASRTGSIAVGKSWLDEGGEV